MISVEPIEFWEFFDLYTLGILFIIVGSLVVTHYRKNGSLLSTISETVAHSHHSSLIFSVVMMICFPLYYAFIWFWVAPLTQMPVSFYYLLTISALFEVIFVWVPATDGRSRKIHQIMSSLVGVAMLAAPLFILLYGTGLSTVSRISILVFTAMAVILVGLLLIKSTRKYTFLYETIYCAAFLATISVIAHS